MGPFTVRNICISRLCIASVYMYIINLCQLHQGVDSLAQWLGQWISVQGVLGSRQVIFSYALFLFITAFMSQDYLQLVKPL